MADKLGVRPDSKYIVTDSHTGSGRKLTYTIRTAETGVSDIVNNPYYIVKGHDTKDGKKKGKNCSIQGNPDPGVGTRPYTWCVCPNCVGWVRGRFHEILHELSGKGDQSDFEYLNWSGNAKDFVTNAIKYDKLSVGQIPMPGAIMVWSHGSYGHVAIVEEVINNTKCKCSESGWSFGVNNMGLVRFYTRSIGTGNWFGGVNWGSAPQYKFIGFIYNPLMGSGITGVEGSLNYGSDSGGYDPEIGSIPHSTPLNASSGGSFSEIEVDYEIQERDIEVTKQQMKTVEYEGELNRVKSVNLLSYPSYVETPYIKVNIGGHDFGVVYNKSYPSAISRVKNDKMSVEYPNYIQDIRITKVNGAVNTYEIGLIYQIEAGNDPNLLDKIFASVGYGKIKISYGDMSSPTFIYREEEAIITKVTSNVEFSQSRITYRLFCTSTSLGLYANYENFEEHPNTQPSEVIRGLLKTNRGGILDAFDGMNGKIDMVDAMHLIPSDDKAVDIPAKPHTDVITYLNFLVSYMVSNSDNIDSPLKNSTYYMTICDDTYDERAIDPEGQRIFGGSYFKITKVDSNTKTLATVDTYEVDIGYPSQNQVMSFRITDDNSWALLYNYTDSIDYQKYAYEIDDNGNLITTDSPNITTSALKNKTTPIQKTWWTQMTKFPISATLQIKGLVRTVMLMTYIRVNSIFYGQRHVSSGLYIITKQVDTIDGNGYRTELTLQRVGGDEDYLTSITEKVTQKYRVRKGESQTESNATAKKDWEEDREKWFGYVPEGSTYR